MNHGLGYPRKPDEKEKFVGSAYREGDSPAYALVQEAAVEMKGVQVVLKNEQLLYHDFFLRPVTTPGVVRCQPRLMFQFPALWEDALQESYHGKRPGHDPLHFSQLSRKKGKRRRALLGMHGERCVSPCRLSAKAYTLCQGPERPPPGGLSITGDLHRYFWDRTLPSRPETATGFRNRVRINPTMPIPIRIRKTGW